MLHRPLILGLLALALFAAGCGGDDGDGGGASGADDAAVTTAPDSPGEGARAEDEAPDASDSDDAGPPRVKPSSLTKAQFIKRADRICNRERRAQLRQAGAFAQDGQEDVFEEIAREVLGPAHLRKAEAIRKLGAPRGDVAQIEALLRAMRADGTAMTTSPPPAVDGYAAQLRRSSRLAARYGLPECASTALF